LISYDLGIALSPHDRKVHQLFGDLAGFQLVRRIVRAAIDLVARHDQLRNDSRPTNLGFRGLSFNSCPDQSDFLTRLQPCVLNRQTKLSVLIGSKETDFLAQIYRRSFARLRCDYGHGSETERETE
jgi:hypothetical protein